MVCIHVNNPTVFSSNAINNVSHIYLLRLGVHRFFAFDRFHFETFQKTWDCLEYLNERNQGKPLSRQKLERLRCTASVVLFMKFAAMSVYSQLPYMFFRGSP